MEGRGAAAASGERSGGTGRGAASGPPCCSWDGCAQEHRCASAGLSDVGCQHGAKGAGWSAVEAHACVGDGGRAETGVAGQIATSDGEAAAGGTGAVSAMLAGAGLCAAALQPSSGASADGAGTEVSGDTRRGGGGWPESCEDGRAEAGAGEDGPDCGGMVCVDGARGKSDTARGST